jgi:hypothetical protein
MADLTPDPDSAGSNRRGHSRQGQARMLAGRGIRRTDFRACFRSPMWQGNFIRMPAKTL